MGDLGDIEQTNTQQGAQDFVKLLVSGRWFLPGGFVMNEVCGDCEATAGGSAIW